MTVAVAIGVAWIVGRTTSSEAQKKTETPVPQPSQHTWNWSTVAALILLGLMLTGYVADALKLENFADGDGHLFTHDTLKGHNMGLSLWPEQGRFFPFGHQEFNLIRHLTSSAAGYHAMPVVQIVIICCVLLFLDDELSITARALLAAVVLILPGIVISFTELPVPDRNFVFWLVSLLFFLKLFERSLSLNGQSLPRSLLSSLIYYKETAFLLLLGFATGRLLLRCWRTDRFGVGFHRIRDKESRLDVCFIALSTIFLLYYFVAMMPHMSMKYADQQRLSLANTFLYYIRMDLLAWCFVATVARRVYLILQRRVTPVPFWDGLALGGLTCFAAYLYLRFGVTLLSSASRRNRGAIRWPATHSFLAKNAEAHDCRGVGSCVYRVASICVLFSFYCVRAKKHHLRQGQDSRRDWCPISQRSKQSPKALFSFRERVRAYGICIVSHLQGHSCGDCLAQSSKLHDVALATKSDVAKDGPCVDYLPFVCHAGNGPVAGDLVIELPDDDESLAQMSPYQKEGDLLFSYEPHPSPPMWVSPFANFLRLASVQFQRKPIPDRWLHASVTDAK